MRRYRVVTIDTYFIQASFEGGNNYMLRNPICIIEKLLILN